MNSPIKKIILFVAVLVLSYLTASYFGSWYDNFSPQYGGWITSNEEAISFVGFFISYIFLTPFIFGIFGIKRNKHWIIWPLLPAALLMFAADRSHFFIPVLLIAVALVLAYLIRLVSLKLRHPQTSVR